MRCKAHNASYPLQSKHSLHLVQMFLDRHLHARPWGSIPTQTDANKRKAITGLKSAKNPGRLLTLSIIPEANDKNQARLLKIFIRG